jgi:hypothetical protein
MGAFMRDWHERAPLICGIDAYVGARIDEGLEHILARELTREKVGVGESGIVGLLELWELMYRSWRTCLHYLIILTCLHSLFIPFVLFTFLMARRVARYPWLRHDFLGACRLRHKPG